MADPENNIVREWLRTLDLSHHLDNFIDNGYDDLETCKQIGEDDMDAIGVQDLRQREELRQAVARLKQEGGTAVYFTLMGPETDYIYEDEVAVDYGYGEDEDEKVHVHVHSMMDGGRSGICDCNKCDCLQDNSCDVQPQCYMDRHRWKWTEHHLRRGSYEGATEFRQMLDRPIEEEVLVKKPRSSSAVERGGFVEAIGGMSPHQQQRRMFHSLKESGQSQHSGSSLTSTGSDSSSGPTSPEHAMNAGAEDGASRESSEGRKGRSRSLRNLFKNIMKIPGDQNKTDGSKQGLGDSAWTAAGSNLSNEAILQTMMLVKEKKLTPEEAWAKAMEMEMQERRKKESSLSPSGMTQLSPAPAGRKSPDRTKSNKAKLKNSGSKSAEQSPITPSDTDSARGTEGATGSDESPRSAHNYYEPPELYPGLMGQANPADCKDNLVISESREVDPNNSRIGMDDILSPVVASQQDDVFTVGGQSGAVTIDEDGLTFKNGHAELVSCSEEQLANLDESLSMSEYKMGLEKTDSVELEHAKRFGNGRGSGGNSPALEDKGEYLEPLRDVPIVTGIPKRNRAASSPALSLTYASGPLVQKKPPRETSKTGKSITQMLRNFGTLKKTSHKSTPSPTQSPDGSGTDRFSEASDCSLERDSTLSSFSSGSSKSSGEAENRQPSNMVEPHFLNSLGEYIGPYTNLAVVTQDFQPSPYDRDGLPLKTGDLVYITVRVGGYWEGVCGQRRGKFKFINVRVLSPEEEEKQKESMEMDICDNDDGSDMTRSEFMPKLSSLKELLERIECQQYYSLFQLHDFATLEQFKYLETVHLDSLNIVDPEHKVKILTAAQILRDPKSGKDRAASQQLHGLLWSTRNPKCRISSRDSGFYASTETCVSFESSGLLRRSEAGDSLIEECETGYHDDDDKVTDGSLQENSNVNNSNCINVVRNQNGSNMAGRIGNKPCRHGVPVKNNRNGHQLLGSPQCQRKEGNGSASPLAHHVCRVHTNGSSTKCAQQKQHQHQQQSVTVNPAWNDMTPYRDSPLFKHRHLVATFSDPGSAQNSPRLRPSLKPPHKHPLKTSCGKECPSPDVMPRVSSEDRARWRKSALLEMYGIRDTNRFHGSGSLIQSSISKTHPSPKLSRHVMEQYQYHAYNAALNPASPAPKGRRKSRSVSPHKRHHHHHHHHRQDLMSNSSVHASPTLPLRASKSPRQQASAQLEWIVDRTLKHEGIDLKGEPYSNKMGFCGIPSALVQRYAEELEAEVTEVAVCLESIRVRELVNACRCWFRSDTLANQSGKVIYAGTGSSVEEWLTSLGLPMYIEAFTLSGWDEMDIVVHMEEEDLEKCGIDKVWHLRRLMTALEHLKMSWKPV